jgi:hypothetical protein
MLDFSPVLSRQMGIDELVEDLTVSDLRRLSNEMIDRQLGLIAACTDEDVVFVPEDPDAHDPAALTPEEGDMAWTLGHVIVHTTASSEEAAYLAVELARGVEYRSGRSRYETQWDTVTTIEQCRARLEESRRMRLASLEMWPVPPHLSNTFKTRSGKQYNAIVRFVFGLMHDDSHLHQIAEIVRQVKGGDK